MPETTRRLRGMVMTLTERCNLRCDYCYVPVERGRSMSAETAARATDWFVANAATEGKLTLSFFGGEPFLAAAELQRATQRARAGLAGQAVRVTVPTNGLALAPDVLAWCRREGIELAISIDGDAGTCGRNHAAGGSCAGDLVALLPRVLPELPPSLVLARMTVTPANVGSLCANVRALARMGFARVAYLPDDTVHWDAEALALWRREHQRMVTWMVGAHGAGRQVPDLPAWRAIEARLLHKRPRGRCGAGVTGVTVAPDGAIFPCYRFPYAPSAEAWQLGDVRRGITRPERVSQLELLDANHLRPERGGCASCTAADGCTHFCPALGFIVRRDVGAVPEVACGLMQAQVEAVRELCVRRSQGGRSPSTARSLAAAAVMAVAMTGAASCQLYPTYAVPADANVAPEAGREVPIIKLDAAPKPDAAPDRAPADASATEAAAAVDGGSLDTDDPYVGGYCPPYVGGYCP
jgi:radical SAM protein with 4Fe4S-binding SPASM domain